jgi:hypothetical protein
MKQHKLIRVGATRHRCLLCGRLFHNLTHEEAVQIAGECTPPQSTPAGLISLELSDDDIDVLVNLPRFAAFVTGQNSDSAQRKGDALAAQIEAAWEDRRDKS